MCIFSNQQEENYELLFANNYVDVCSCHTICDIGPIMYYNHLLISLMGDGNNKYYDNNFNFIFKELVFFGHYAASYHHKPGIAFRIGSYSCNENDIYWGYPMNSLCYYIYKIVKKIRNESDKHYKVDEKCNINVLCVNTNKIIKEIAIKQL